LGCLIVFALFAAGLGALYYKNRASIGSVMQSANQMVGTAQKAQMVRTALAKYKSDTGHYPASLTDLVPQYLPNADALHTPADPNPDPTHVSFDYTQPSGTAPGSTPLLSYHSYMSMNVAGMTQKIDTKTTFTIDGQMNEDQTQTVTTPDGKTTTTTTHMSGVGSTPTFGGTGSAPPGGSGSP
jgi:type II secretory pathway pseudopilin PulG